MITLRLFHQSDPFHQIDERCLDDGALVIGRGEDVDWPLPDPTRLLSRRHCSIRMEGHTPVLQDLSANGVYLGPGRERAPTGEAFRLGRDETLRLGDYMIVVDALAGAQARPVTEHDQADQSELHVVKLEAEGLATVDPIWVQPTTEPAKASARQDDDGTLLDAFCEGAHLDASAFADDDPAEVMRRLGAVYQQMVLGLTVLMDERTSVKSEYRMDRTAVRSAGNNPFRWASAQRVAVDLLRERKDGFLSGPDAVKAAFGDVRKHLLCVFAGVKAALRAVLLALSPKAVEASIPTQGTFLKGHVNAAWRQYIAIHEACQRDSKDGGDGLMNREFSAAYARRLSELDEASEAGS
jgi:predicted component of type VI protein secretion system